MPAVVIVGTGFAGLGMAIALKRAGYDDFVILEKADDIGGTWRDNTYPGCACDVQSHVYSYSFAPNPHWQRMFASQPEIWAYLRDCARRYDLYRHIRFGVEFTGAAYDDATGTWRVGTAAGESWYCRAVVTGLGALHRPAVPELPGLARFTGPTWHSAQWNHAYDLTGRRVAVVGTGASTVQIVPAIADRVARLDVYQRTPPWIMPRPDRDIGPVERRLYARVPAVQRLHRAKIYWQLEGRVLGFAVTPRLMTLAQRIALRHLRRQVPDPALRARLTPTYTMGCKRVLVSDDYYPALTRPNVDLVTAGIREVTPTGIVTADGAHREVDAIVFGTGFHVTDAFDALDVTGRDGRKLRDTWRDGIEAYKGVAVTGFPNLFLLVGPNSGLGHNSMIFMIEAQVRYAMQALRPLLRGTSRWADVRPEVQSRYNAGLQRRLGHSVWLSGCQSWYLDERGRNTTIWPGFSWTYWLRTRRLRRAEYEVG